MRQKTSRRFLRLRTLRRTREMTQAELARRVGVAKSYISEIEGGKAQPSLQTARALASQFGVSVEEAFELVEVPA